MRNILIILIIFSILGGKSHANDEWDNVRFRNLSNGQYNISSGTGFFISTYYIITNYHVVENCINYSARGAIPPTPLELIAYDEKFDLAILKSPTIPKYLPVIRKDTHNIKPGDLVFAMGYPLERGEIGIYNSIPVHITKFDHKDIASTIEFTLSSLNHGNSGGPLMDSSGRIIGIIQGKVTKHINNKILNENGVAIRSEMIESMLSKLNLPYYYTHTPTNTSLQNPENIAKNFIVNIHCVRTTK